MTTEFIQTLLRSNESITVRCATRLFVLNTPLFVEAIATLRDDEKQAVLELFTKTAITEAAGSPRKAERVKHLREVFKAVHCAPLEKSAATSL